MHGASQSPLLTKEVTTHFGVAQSPLTLVLLLSWPRYNAQNILSRAPLFTHYTVYAILHLLREMLGCQIVCED
jgi:hypothetical protein